MKNKSKNKVFQIISKRIFFISFILTFQLFSQNEFNEIGIIHKGDGGIVSPGIMNINKGIIENISQYNDSLDQEQIYDHHITPTFFDLNIYDSSRVIHYDSLLVRNGIVYYLLKAENRIYFHKVAPFSENKLLGYFYENNELTSGGFHNLYHKFEDDLAFSKYYLDKQNLNKLPHNEQLSADNFKKLLKGKYSLWLHNFTKKQFTLFSKLLKKYEIEIVYLPKNIDWKITTLDNATVIVDLPSIFQIEENVNLINDFESYFGLNSNLYYKIFEKEKLFNNDFFKNNPILEILTDEEFIQYCAIFPSQFFGLDDRIGILRKSFSANYVVFTAEPFTEDSFVKKVYIDGIEIYSNKDTTTQSN
ncbi:MAG: hypothetical protein U9R41_03825 [Candidatus Marinimicrobia bacterium]|nr:hypothetical protein [Candidatus Neomarinimicrobiota bacterium]